MGPVMDPADRGEAVFLLVLRNRQSSLPWSTIGRLLCTSKQTADMIHENCGGTKVFVIAGVSGSPGRICCPPGIIRWMSRHAVLLRSLKHVKDSRPRAQRVESAADSTTVEELVAALAQAAALPRGLKLRLLQTSSLSLVKAMHGRCSTLTCLDLSLSEEMLFPTAKEAAACITGAVAEAVANSQLLVLLLCELTTSPF